MKSTPVIEAVVDHLDLDSPGREEKELEISQFREIISQIKTNIKTLLKRQPSEEAGGEMSLPGEHMTIPDQHQQAVRKRAVIDMVRNKINIAQVSGTRLFTITVKDKDPEMAAAIANTLAEKYMELDLAGRVNSSKQTLEWLNNELYEQRRVLEDAERKFYEYRQQNQLFTLEGKQGLASQNISEFNSRYLETRNRRLELEARINELNKSIRGDTGIANVRSLIESPMINTIYARIVELELEVTRLSRTFKPKHPKIVQAQSELEKNRHNLVAELKKELASLESERQVLLAREKVLEKTIGEFESDALKTSTVEMEYAILKRNVEANQDLYELMVSQMKESNILQKIESSDLRVVENALIPTSPLSDKNRQMLILSIVAGLLIGIGISFFLEYMDRTIRTDEDVQNHLNLTVLSVIPAANSAKTYGYGETA
jgi:uncharacterized protein involved in exopolysaccharide biosynthesis